MVADHGEARAVVPAEARAAGVVRAAAGAVAPAVAPADRLVDTITIITVITAGTAAVAAAVAAGAVARAVAGVPAAVGAPPVVRPAGLLAAVPLADRTVEITLPQSQFLMHQ